MSYDPKLQNKCDHKINWESYPLESDRITVNLKYPVSSVYGLSLRINNAVIAPNRYTVISYKQAQSLNPASSVRMSYKVPDWEPLIEVNYTTYANNCPKCLAVKYVDDVIYTPSGDFQMAQKEYLLMQTVEKAIITKIASNPFHDWYGTGLQSLIGTKITDLSFMKNKIIEQVSASIEKIKNVQKQLVASNRKVDPGELFGQLLNVDVQQMDDPTIIMVTVVFTSQSNKQMEFSQLIDLSSVRERVAFA